MLHYRQCFLGGALACVTGRLNSASSDSHGHGRVDPAATGAHLWEQGTPNGTAGISSIFKDNLRNRGHRADQGWRRTDLHRWANGVCYIGIRTVYTFRIGGKKEGKKKKKLGCECKGFRQGVHTCTTTCASWRSISVVAKILLPG